MNNVTLDLRNIETKAALHIYLQYMLDLPAYYGRNLDALHDCLTEMNEPVCITVLAQGACGEMAAYLPRLMQVIEDAAEENRHLMIKQNNG